MPNLKKLSLVFAVTSAITTLSLPVYADHGSLGFGLGTASPIVTDTGVTLPEGMWAGGVRTQFISFNSASDQTLLDLKNANPDNPKGDVHSVSTLLQPSLFAAYGVTDNLSLGIRVPWTLRSGVRSPTDAVSPSDTVDKLGDSNGFGDTTLFSQYRFFHSADNLNHVSAIVALKMPTGATGVYTTQGATFEPHHQPGSGSWDPLFGLAFTRGMGQFSFDTSFMYTVATPGMHDVFGNRVDMGNVFNYNFALSYALGAAAKSGLQASSNNSAWTLVLELNGESREKQRAGGENDPNSGGHTLYISPGVRYAGGSNWNTALSVGAPIVTDYNGYQTAPEYRIIHRLSVTF